MPRESLRYGNGTLKPGYRDGWSIVWSKQCRQNHMAHIGKVQGIRQRFGLAFSVAHVGIRLKPACWDSLGW